MVVRDSLPQRFLNTLDLRMNRSKSKTFCKSWFFYLAVLVFFMQGCATTKPPPEDPLAYKNRTESNINEDVTVTVAVPTIAEARAIYGVKLAYKHIQPVWLEVKNDSTDTYWFLPSGTDPDYFSPSEAAFAFYSAKDETNRQLDEKFQKLQFENPIRPASTRAGFVLVNLDEGFKAVDIDLISREAVKSFSFIIDDPEFKADHKEVDFETIYGAEDIINIEDEEALRRVLEELPCCTTNTDGKEHGDPLNLVLIGESIDMVPALVRRNWHATEIIWSRALIRTIKSFIQGERYRYSPISPLYVYGRPQDVGWQKARGTINERNHMRFWLSPIRFRGKKVFVGQISRDIGVKFTLKSPTISTHVIDPDVDEARRYFLEDLAYSQALARYGFVKGVGVVTKDAPRMNLVGDPFYTDGLRAVLFFEPRPYTLSDIDMLEWEIPAATYTKTE
jgi:LssY C-terminus